MSFLSVTGGLAARVALLLGLVFCANSAHAGRFLYTGGHGLDDARVSAIGHTYAQFPGNDAGWAAALAGSYGSFDAILAGEGAAYSISPATRASIASYVSNGGRIIVASDHNGNVDFLNPVFGYATTVAYGCLDDESVAGSLQAAATGSTFAGGPPTVSNLSCTSALRLASVPAAARTLYAGSYAGSGTALAFAANYGSGRVVWLGWDYCCGRGTSQLDDWYLVLDNSIKFTGFFTTCSAEGFTGSRLTLCRQVCEIPQTATKLTSLIKLYTTSYRTSSPCPEVVARL